ncbi:F0F1 ATP synthase subunit gamma [Desulfogranum japonicum]|uniref:F0F1 ATP synthase subunit gamma n=1 Tax=Desulfogranum japonicum TaxID=231447 RepID=UPI0004023703|nr:F0F1 ATP synthase subunit gamma [Desulfogranum japonicum]
METLEQLQRKIETAHDLLSVVKTMKSLAAVNIRQYEGAAASLDRYYVVVDTGLQALFREQAEIPQRHVKKHAVYLVLGSDQGMCGQFNEVVVKYAYDHAEKLKAEGNTCVFWAAGERVHSALEQGFGAAEFFSLPNSISGISNKMQRIMETFATWQKQREVGTLYIVYNRQEKKTIGYHPFMQRIFPFDDHWLEEKRKKEWPSRCIPMLGLPPAMLFEHLLHQYMFASFFRAFAQSMASENAARLTAMQAAEKNIMEMREKLQGTYREARQNVITSELLDIVSGFEAVIEG